MRLDRDTRPYYACRAEALLQSWICGDTARLQSELDCTVNSRWPRENNIDRYRVELLMVVARGMRNCPDLYAQRSMNPVVGVYLDVLQNLSTNGSTAGSSALMAASGPFLVRSGS